MLLKTKIMSSDPLAMFQLLVLCPALTATTTLSRALAVGATLAISLVLSSLLVSLFRGITPAKLRVPVYLLLHSACVTLVYLVLRAFLPAAVTALGVYLPILAVSCLAVLRLEANASQNAPGAAVMDGCLYGLEFMILMLLCGFIRELFGAGKLFATTAETGGITVFPSAPLAFLGTPGGALLLVALFAAILQGTRLRSTAKAENAQNETV